MSNVNFYLEHITDFPLEAQDYVTIFQSDWITAIQKIALASLIDPELLTRNPELKKKIAQINHS